MIGVNHNNHNTHSSSVLKFALLALVCSSGLVLKGSGYSPGSRPHAFLSGPKGSLINQYHVSCCDNFATVPVPESSSFLTKFTNSRRSGNDCITTTARYAEAKASNEEKDDSEEGDSNDASDVEPPKPQSVMEDYKGGLSEVSGMRSDRSSQGDPTKTDGKKQVKNVVMKFGGSSLANAERVEHVAQLIKDQIAEGYFPRAVVCSAMGKTTNSLLSAGDFALEGRVNVDAIRTLHLSAIETLKLPDQVREEVTELLDECRDMLNGVRLLQELSPKSLDQLVSYGERCSVRIMAARLNQIGVPAQAFDAWDVGIKTDSHFGDAHIKVEETASNIRRIMGERIDPSIVAVVTGFIAHDPNRRITTLGRGGSDLTATTIGAALKLDEVQVWKDVDGILTTDPRIVPAAVPVPDVSFEEASELAYFGAQVLHPIAMQPAMKNNIPVRVKNSYNPSHPGTVIQKREGQGHLVTAITCKRDVTVLDIVSTRMLGAYGFLSTVFNVFEKHKLSVDVLASSEVSISLTLDKKQKIDDNSLIMKDLSFCSEVSLKRNRAILTLISDVDRSSEVLATVFRVFHREGIKVLMLSQGASKVNISFILREDQLDDAIRHLHSCFFEGQCIVDFEADNNGNGKKKTQSDTLNGESGTALVGDKITVARP